MTTRVGALSCSLLLLVACAATDAGAQSAGVTITPDSLVYLVSKDVGPDRWTIGVNLTPGGRIVSATGNVLLGGVTATFLACTPREDSKDTLNDPGAELRFRCRQAGPCGSTARGCAEADWSLANDDVRIPASFFLPGAGQAARAPRPGPVLADAAVTATNAPLQSADRGATLSFDGANHLVSKDYGNQRWAISVNFPPGEDAKANRQRPLSITGNVYVPSESPKFVYCTIRPDSTGDLADAASVFRLRCQGADACSDRTTCAQRWTLITDDTSIPASFFLPPGGLPQRPLSDDGLFVIGYQGDPPSIGVGEGNFDTPSSTRARQIKRASALGVAVDTCSGTCTTRVGACREVRGVLTKTGGGVCICQVDPPIECITCGDALAGTCGGRCEYLVSDSGLVARGTCLPFDANSSTCGCFAEDSDFQAGLRACNGPFNATCGNRECCVDDPRDGCVPNEGDTGCVGLCLDADTSRARLCDTSLTPLQIQLRDNPDSRCQDAACDFRFCGTDFDGSCPDSWNGSNDGCDCGCQFEDPDCQGTGPPPGGSCDAPECDFLWCNTEIANACPDQFFGSLDGCDCGCQFEDPDCANGGFNPPPPIPPIGPPVDDQRCAAPGCIPWCGTELDNACPDAFNGTGDGCDCGCQFVDPDCDTQGPVVDPRCTDPACEFAWCGSPIDQACPPQFDGDGVCDCGCQFLDADCFGSVLPDPSDPRCSDPACDYLFCGTPNDNACPESFNGAGDGCDCGCQFSDADCGSLVPPADCSSPACDFRYCGTPQENACPDSYFGSGDGCDCGCQFEDPDCSAPPPPPPPPDERCLSDLCDYRYCGTPLQDSCPDSFIGSGDGCDCGCQFEDPDCFTPPDDPCGSPACQFTYCGTPLENNCPDSFYGSGDGCDCGCQFDDPDCAF